MSSGPIEFMGEGPAHEVPETQFGGVDGLIQPERDDGAFAGSPESRGGHTLSDDAVGGGVNAEKSSILARVAGVPLVGREQVTGESATGEDVVDPLTGRVLTGGGSVPGGAGAGELSGLQP